MSVVVEYLQRRQFSKCIKVPFVCNNTKLIYIHTTDVMYTGIHVLCMYTSMCLMIISIIIV